MAAFKASLRWRCKRDKPHEHGYSPGHLQQVFYVARHRTLVFPLPSGCNHAYLQLHLKRYGGTEAIILVVERSTKMAPGGDIVGGLATICTDHSGAIFASEAGNLPGGFVLLLYF